MADMQDDVKQNVHLLAEALGDMHKTLTEAGVSPESAAAITTNATATVTYKMLGGK